MLRGGRLQIPVQHEGVPALGEGAWRSSYVEEVPA